MPDYLTTKEVAELLRIKERKVYDLAASGKIPCSKAMGKLLFARHEITEWLARASATEVSLPTERPNVFLGSHDPLLEWALRESSCGIASYFDGSTDGLDRFENGEGIASALHLFDRRRDNWNSGLVGERFGKQSVVLIAWARRARGLILSPQAGKTIAGLADLAGKLVARRQAQAGAQQLFEHLLADSGLQTQHFTYTAPLRSETDAATAVLEGKCDAAFGLAALASQLRLPFVPIIEEQFDLLIERRAWFEPPMQRLIKFCRSAEFTRRATELGGYNVSELGTVRFNAPN